MIKQILWPVFMALTMVTTSLPLLGIVMLEKGIWRGLFVIGLGVFGIVICFVIAFRLPTNQNEN